MADPALTAKQTVTISAACKDNITKRVYQVKAHNDVTTNGSSEAAVAAATATMKQQSSSLNKIRLLYFFFRFSTGSLIPFMPLFMQHCGFNNEEIGTLQAIRPIVTMISAPFWGGLADRTGKKKLILMVSLRYNASTCQSYFIAGSLFHPFLLTHLIHHKITDDIHYECNLSTISFIIQT